MTCYFTHLKEIFNKAGVEITKDNRQGIDRAIHSIVGIEYKNCATIWKEVKKRITEDEEGFVAELKRSFN